MNSSQGKLLYSTRETALKSIAKQLSYPDTIRFPYGAVLRYVSNKDWSGACHATSAMMHIMFSENGHKSRLLLGQGKLRHQYFDHSWVEIDGKTFDIAIAFGLEAQTHSGPIFAGIDLDSGIPPLITYGAPVVPFDQMTQAVQTQSITDYMDKNPTMDMWDTLSSLFSRAQIPFGKNHLQEKYKKAFWEVAI